MIEKEKGPVTSEISMVNDKCTLTVAANDVIKIFFKLNQIQATLLQVQ